MTWCWKQVLEQYSILDPSKCQKIQLSVFVNIFRYDTSIWKIISNFICLLLCKNRNKNIISRHVHNICIHDMVQKTRCLVIFHNMSKSRKILTFSYPWYFLNNEFKIPHIVNYIYVTFIWPLSFSYIWGSCEPQNHYCIVCVCV